MALQHELGFPNPIDSKEHEALLNIVLTAGLLSKEGDRVLKSQNLTASQFNVLMILKYQSENGRANQSRLGEMLLVNRSNVTGLVDRIENAGWARRVPDRIDRRVKYVELTPSGEKILEKAERVYFGRIREVMKAISAKDCDALCQNLEKLREALYA